MQSGIVACAQMSSNMVPTITTSEVGGNIDEEGVDREFLEDVKFAQM